MVNPILCCAPVALSSYECGSHRRRGIYNKFITELPLASTWHCHYFSVANRRQTLKHKGLTEQKQWRCHCIEMVENSRRAGFKIQFLATGVGVRVPPPALTGKVLTAILCGDFFRGITPACNDRPTQWKSHCLWAAPVALPPAHFILLPAVKKFGRCRHRQAAEQLVLNRGVRISGRELTVRHSTVGSRPVRGLR